MKQKIVYIAGVLLLTVAMQSCKLESEVFDDINTNIYPKTERDARDLITGNVYYVFGTSMLKNGSANVYDGLFNRANGMQILADIASDYGMCSWGALAGGAWGGLSFGTGTPTDQYTARLPYDKGYLKFFGKMLLTIDRIQGMDIDADRKAQYIAEAKCGLGFLGFVFYDWYGPVVVPDLATLKKPVDATILPRLTEAEMKNFIETNLKEAAAVLPATIPYGDAEYGRFTAGLCHTVLLKFYMQTGQWANAKAEGLELMKPEYGYGLVTTAGTAGSAYENLFSVAGEGNKETVWAVNCAPGQMVYEWFPNALTNATGGSAGWGGFHMPYSAYNSFEDNDDRKKTIIDAPHQHGADPVKYEINISSGSHSATDWMIYRYADVITLYAEAVVRDGGDYAAGGDTAPLALLNSVRTRAGLPAYTAADITSKEDFLDKLILERAHEFYWEGCRRQDLIRHGLDKYRAAMTTKCTEYSLPAPLYTNKYLPLPQSLIIEGKGIIKNNPPFGDYTGN